MGMTIDEAITRYKNNAEYERAHGNLQGCLEFRQLVEWLRKYQLMQADYENRLKADLVDMLRFLWNDIENLDAPICDYASSDCISKWQVHEIIQQKINAIKAESEEK